MILFIGHNDYEEQKKIIKNIFLNKKLVSNLKRNLNNNENHYNEYVNPRLNPVPVTALISPNVPSGYSKFVMSTAFRFR